MRVTTGIDIIEVDRIKDIIEETKEVFLNKIYTQNEIDYSEKSNVHKYEKYAARFAAKEAVYKALDILDNTDINWKDIEVINKDTGRPYIKLNGALEKYNEIIDSIDISLSHIAETAISSVVVKWR